MTWKNVGDFLIGSAPKIAGLITNPVGEGISLITDALSGKLGVGNNPDEVMKELKSNPEALVKVKQMEFDLEALKIKQSMNETDKASANIKTEAASADVFVRRTRPKLLRDTFYLLAVMMVTGFLSMVVMAVVKVPDATISIIMGFWTEAIKYLSGIFTAGFLGYARYRSVYDKRLQAGKDPSPGLVEGLVKLIKR